MHTRMHITTNHEYGLLGKIVQNMYRYIAEGMDKNVELSDTVNLQTVQAKDYFIEFPGRVAIRTKCLPFDLDIKGGYINKEGKDSCRPIIELSEIDFAALPAALKEHCPGAGLDSRTLTAELGIPLVRTRTGTVYRAGVPSRRSAITLVPGPAEQYTALATRAADAIYKGNAFKEDAQLQQKVQELIGTGEAPKLELRQRQELNTLMADEQQLAMQQAQVAYLAQRAEILQTPAQELKERVENLQYDTGMIAAFLRKRTIAHIRQVMPELTWQQATDVYTKIQHKQKFKKL